MTRFASAQCVLKVLMYVQAIFSSTGDYRDFYPFRYRRRRHFQIRVTDYKINENF